MVPKGGQVIVMPKPKSIAKALAGTGKGIYGDVRRYLKAERKSWETRR
jgi:hypothetical protein